MSAWFVFSAMGFYPNVQDWFKAGVDAIGVGGKLNKLGAQGKFDEVTEIASQYVSRTREAK